jgi:glycerol-3-phosphate acyltransferase PlsY
LAIVLVAFGYLCGSVPWGLLIARRAGIDVRRTGSGNIGATNVARSAGSAAGLATLVADVLKGALPVILARAASAPVWVPAAAGGAAFLGHVFPVTLGFAGGKGVATALGVVAVLSPWAAGAALAVFAVSVGLTRYVSLGSVLGAATAPVATALLGGSPPVMAVTALMAVVVLLRHRSNLARLRAGTEPRFRPAKGQAKPRK